MVYRVCVKVFGEEDAMCMMVRGLLMTGGRIELDRGWSLYDSGRPRSHHGCLRSMKQHLRPVRCIAQLILQELEPGSRCRNDGEDFEKF